MRKTLTQKLSPLGCALAHAGKKRRGPACGEVWQAGEVDGEQHAGVCWLHFVLLFDITSKTKRQPSDIGHPGDKLHRRINVADDS